MARDDFLSIAKYGASIGLKMAAAPCGPMVNRKSAAEMREAGIRRISLSLDAADAETHDSFRGVVGSFLSVLSAAEAASAEGLEFQINSTFSEHNAHQLEDLVDLAEQIGAAAFHPFFLVPTGRGTSLAGTELSPATYEDKLHRVYELSREREIEIKPTCAPHYYRILREREEAAGRRVTMRSHGMSAMTKGCLGGQGFLFLSHTGKLQICGFLDLEAGDVREAGFDIESLWRDAPLFRDVRRTNEYGGKCGVCEYVGVCGGCRARAYAATGDYMEAEPRCLYMPTGELNMADSPTHSDGLDEIDRKLLDFVQSDLPEEREPFAAIAGSCGLEQAEAVERLERLTRLNYIRTFSALLDGKALGYRSTLVALRVPEGSIEETAGRISAHPGVSHNYKRDGEFNLWFTIAVPPHRELRAEVEGLLQGTVYDDLMLLPSLTRYKLRVKLDLGAGGGAVKGGAEAAVGGVSERFRPDATDIRLLSELQKPIPFVIRPWDELAMRTGRSRDEFFARIRRLKDRGVLRRISAALQHRNVGYEGNGMACLQVEKGREDEAGRTAAAFPEVSHCYLRDVPQRWPFSLFAMIHARDARSCRERAAKIAEAAGVRDYLLLFSTKEYKKRRTYFDLEAL